MTELSKIKVRHLEQVSGSLYLADLDPLDGLRNESLPVYVSPGETIELPLVDTVVDSFENGTIKGFAELGLIAVWFVDKDSSDTTYEEIEYDAEGRPASISVWDSSSKNTKHSEHAFSWVNDELQTETISRFDNTGSVVGTETHTFTYDDQDRVVSIEEQETP